MADTSYSPSYVSITYNPSGFGPILFQGFGPGDFVKVAYNTDAASMSVGADGEAIHNISADRSGTIEVTLQASSPTNQALAAVEAAQRLNPVGVGPLNVQDVSGTHNISGTSVRIRKSPDFVRGTELGVNVWIFQAGHITMGHGKGIVA